MNNDRRFEEEPDRREESGLVSRLRLAFQSWQLRRIDAALGFFQRWRSAIEPAAEEDVRGGRKSALPRGDALLLGGVATPKPKRWRGFLIVLALLLASAIASMAFSYRLLSRVIASDNVLIDDLRDQVAQMEKAEARSVNIEAKSQLQIAAGKKAMRECQAAIQSDEEQLVQLRQQVSALTPSPPQKPLSRSATARPAAAVPRAAPQKTGDCTMGTANAAADLARCVDAFNRQ